MPTIPPPYGRPVSELTDDELERQGKNAHDTRNWVFLNGTAEQFATHTTRMLDLEQEYLRRHPKRTWQGSGGAPDTATDVETLKVALRGIVSQLESLLSREAGPDDESAISASGNPELALIARIAAAHRGRLHRLEVHQAAREVGLERAALARLYTADPPLITTEQQDRVITPAGRAWLETATTKAAQV